MNDDFASTLADDIAAAISAQQDEYEARITSSAMADLVRPIVQNSTALRYSWQPVTETSPPADGVKLLAYDSEHGYDMVFAARNKDTWLVLSIDDNCYDFAPTHWTPLPDPPTHA